MQRLLIVLSILFVLLNAGCSTPSPTPSKTTKTTPTPTQVQPQPAQVKRTGPIRTIAQVEWSDPLGAHLLGVDPNKKLAYIQLKRRTSPHGMVIDAYDLNSGKRVMRWSAKTSQAKKLVKGYPRFLPFNQSFERDLQRYADIVRRVGPWSHREATAPLGVSVSPNGQHILYTVPPKGRRDGDWLVLADGQGKRIRRFASNVTASYRVNFSPDSSAVAWMGGQARYARPNKQLGYVLHTADLKGTIKTYPTIRDLLRTPQWTKKGDALFVLGKVYNKVGQQHCIFYVDVQVQKSKNIYCYQGDLDFIYNQESDQLLVLQHPNNGPSTPNTRMLTYIDTKRLKPITQYAVETPLGFGAFGHFVDSTHVALFTHGGQKLTIVETKTGKKKRSITVSSAGSLGGRHTSQIVGKEMILLRHQKGKVELIGVNLQPTPLD